jgi:hypothetical protein
MYCKACRADKPEQEFHKCATSKRGFAYYCKVCANLKAKAWHKVNGKKPGEERGYRLLRQYGLTLEAYEGLLEQQNHKCKICDVALIGGHQTHIDHCHNSNKIRGILCTNCNRGLGHFQDSTLNLERAIEYLQRI